MDPAMSAMHGEAVYTYLAAMRDEARAAYRSWQQIQDARSRLRAVAVDDASEDGCALSEAVEAEERLLAAIQALLTAQARLSLFIFPQRTAGARAATRAAELRLRLGIGEVHEISERGPRNAWMHLDESIDAYIWEIDPVGLVTAHFGDARDARSSGDDRRVLRLIDPMANTISLLGASHDIERIFKSVKDVALRIDQAIERLET